MPSLPYPDSGSRVAILPSGKPAVGARVYLYADQQLTIPAEVYRSTNGIKGELHATDEVGRRYLVLDAFGRIPDFYGPASGQDRLWGVINGAASPIDADYNNRIDALEVGNPGGGGGGGNEALLARVIDLEVALETAQTGLQETLTLLGTTQNQLTAAQAEISTAQTEINASQGEISALQDEVATLQGGVDALQTALALAVARIEALEEGVVTPPPPPGGVPFTLDPGDPHVLFADDTAAGIAFDDSDVVVDFDVAAGVDLDGTVLIATVTGDDLENPPPPDDPPFDVDDTNPLVLLADDAGTGVDTDGDVLTVDTILTASTTDGDVLVLTTA